MYDNLGPEKIVKVYDPATGMRGILVIDNTARGPAKGGIRMRPGVTEEEVFRLARAMTLKNALAGLPFGGGKSGIIADPSDISPQQKEGIVRAFSRALKELVPHTYIAAPDMNMAEQEMRWFIDANGDSKAATGKPADMGGLPHELGSTGFGVAHATKVALEHADKSMKGATVAVAGFGNVGQFAAKYLTEWGARIVAVSDSSATITDKDELDIKTLMEIKNGGTPLGDLEQESHSRDTIYTLEVDVLIPAGPADVIHDGNVDEVQAAIIVEGANIPMQSEIGEQLTGRGVLIVPDIVANAGGVISSYIEHIGKGEKEMFALVEEKITKSTQAVLERAAKDEVSPRTAATAIATERVTDKNS